MESLRKISVSVQFALNVVAEASKLREVWKGIFYSTTYDLLVDQKFIDQLLQVWKDGNKIDEKEATLLKSKMNLGITETNSRCYVEIRLDSREVVGIAQKVNQVFKEEFERQILSDYRLECLRFFKDLEEINEYSRQRRTPICETRV